jgi:dephospho-CoA kinase
VNLALGLTGPNASGKGEVCSLLAQRGFDVHSLSDIVRDEAERRGLPPHRENLIRIGNLLREEGGSGVLAEKILPRLGRCAVVDSIRNPKEVEALRTLPRFVLIGIQAPLELRFARSTQRAREGDPTTVEEFELRERQENTANPTAQQLRATFALADRVLDNDGSLERLEAALDRLLQRWELDSTR